MYKFNYYKFWLYSIFFSVFSVSNTSEDKTIFEVTNSGIRAVFRFGEVENSIRKAGLIIISRRRDWLSTAELIRINSGEAGLIVRNGEAGLIVISRRRDWQSLARRVWLSTARQVWSRTRGPKKPGLFSKKLLQL